MRKAYVCLLLSSSFLYGAADYSALIQNARAQQPTSALVHVDEVHVEVNNHTPLTRQTSESRINPKIQLRIAIVGAIVSLATTISTLIIHFTQCKN